MPALRTKDRPKISLRPNTLHDDEEDDETCEVPAKQFKQQQLISSPRTPASTKDSLTHNSPPATPTTPYKPCDFVKRRSAAAHHSHSDGKIFSSTYRKDAPSKKIILNVLVCKQENLNLKLKAYPDDTIDFLKFQIETKGWIPAERQRLTYKGKLLEHDSFQLSMYEIVDQASLICHEA